MRHRWIVWGLAVMTFALVGMRDANALGLRLGGHSIVDPGTDTKFAIGLDYDMHIIDALAINSGSLWSFDGDGFFGDLYLGLKVKIPVLASLKVAVRGDFLLRWYYPFQDNVDQGLALGGIAGPGIIWEVAPPLSITMDLDVVFYKFVVPDAWDNAGWQIGLSYLVGIAF